MSIELNYKDIIEKSESDHYLFIDVRSSGEYNEGTIPGAINIPILDNEERSLVGKTYKEDSHEKAKRIGIEIVSEKLTLIYDQIMDLRKKNKELVLFCSRGGFRSSSLVGLFNSIGLRVNKLEGGYKAYRNYLLEELPRITEDINFLVLYGNTGTGKTHILEELRNLGQDVLDLEACANHRGSTLGGVGLGEQNSQKMFESLIFSSLVKRKTNTIYVEGESRRIGKDVIPLYIFQAMKDGIHIKIEADMDKRVQNILKDYVHNTDDDLITSLSHLKRHLGNEIIDNYISLIKEAKYEPVIEDLMVRYYDPLYEHNKRSYRSTFHSYDSRETAINLIKWLKENTPNNN